MKTQAQIERAAREVPIILRKYGSQCEQLPGDTAECLEVFWLKPMPKNEPNWYKMTYRFLSYLLAPDLKDGLLGFLREGGIPTLEEATQIACLTNEQVADYLKTPEGYLLFKGNYDFHYDVWKNMW